MLLNQPPFVMRKIYTVISFSILVGLLFNVGCSKDDEPAPTTGTLSGTVIDATSSLALADVLIIVFDANTNSPTGSTVVSAADGTYSAELDPGSYFIKATKQGYENVPPTGFSAVPFEIVLGQITTNDVEMFASSVTNGGYITGKVTDGTNGVAGTLVVAEMGGEGYSSITNSDGIYSIYNMPAATYDVKAWISGYSSETVSATVSGGAETANIDIVLTLGSAGSVTGNITILSGSNKDVDVSLTHPVTKETIPGLTVTTTNLSYEMVDVPDGQYLFRATFENDDKVMDPDWIVKNGEPYVTVSGATIMNFSITDAVLLISPTNGSTTTQPLEVVSTTPTFEWTDYPQTSSYVIEVTDSNGKVIWGGFSTDFTTKNIDIPKSVTSITFGDTTYGNAPVEDLVSGQIYRWRVYASFDVSSTGGWKLLSVSEDQRGLIKIQ